MSPSGLLGTVGNALVLAVVPGALLSGCHTEERTTADREWGAVERAQAFRSLVQRGRYEEAREMMAADPRRWFAPREGPGEPWRVEPGAGPWSAWDEHFRSEGEVVRWHEGPASATVVVQETNDYFRLLERGSVTNELTYLFDGAGKLTGLVIGTLGERPPGRTEEFMDWARAHEPEELQMLMPGGEIDPSGDHPQRFRALLERWREDAGLEPIEAARTGRDRP